MIHMILLVLAFVLFLLAGLNIAAHPRVNLIGMGLAAWMLSLLLRGV